jgi:hypothetical protein
MPSRLALSRPSSWARAASFQTPGSSRILLTSARRVFFASKSKIPPEFGRAAGQVREGVFDGVELVGFHCGRRLSSNRELYRRGFLI